VSAAGRPADLRTVIAAVRTQFIPIAMTSLSTVIGLIQTATGRFCGDASMSSLIFFFNPIPIPSFFTGRSLSREEKGEVR
jgi:hypothetical protein